jgi:hypothetical protein
MERQVCQFQFVSMEGVTPRVCVKTATPMPKTQTNWTILRRGHGMPCPYDRGIPFSHSF